MRPEACPPSASACFPGGLNCPSAAAAGCARAGPAACTRQVGLVTRQAIAPAQAWARWSSMHARQPAAEELREEVRPHRVRLRHAGLRPCGSAAVAGCARGRLSHSAVVAGRRAAASSMHKPCAAVFLRSSLFELFTTPCPLLGWGRCEHGRNASLLCLTYCMSALLRKHAHGPCV
jgi:hypothetical protein